MWLFSSLGFYSINRTPDGARLQFRARRRQDLVNLKTAYPEEFRGSAVKTIPTADYRWRLETDAAAAGIVMCAMTEDIDYRNFKNRIADTDQADKLTILHDLWHSMHTYQGVQEQTAPHADQVRKHAKKRKSGESRDQRAARLFYEDSLSRP